MTNLRKRMLEELQRRNYASETIRAYLFAVKDVATYFVKRPQTHRGHDRRTDRCTEVLFRPSAPPTVPRHRSGLSETPGTTPSDLERRGSGAVDRIGSDHLPSRDSDDVVRSGIAPRGTLPIEGDRCR